MLISNYEDTNDENVYIFIPRGMRQRVRMRNMFTAMVSILCINFQRNWNKVTKFFRPPYLTLKSFCSVKGMCGIYHSLKKKKWET